MKCKDCLHFDACEGSNGTFDDEYVKDTAFSEDVKQTLIGKGFYPAIVKSVLEATEKEMVGEKE